MNIRFFNKNFDNMTFGEKVFALLLIPVVIAVALSVTLYRLAKGKKAD